MKEEKEERGERGPIISMSTVYPSVGMINPVEDDVMLAAYQVASALISWTLKAEGITRHLIDYVKVTFYKEREKGITIIFKLTLRLPMIDSNQTIEVPWHKNQGTVKISSGGTTGDCGCEEGVVAAVKIAICLFLANKAKEESRKEESLRKLAEEVDNQR